jgi:hypothetical protein
MVETTDKPLCIGSHLLQSRLIVGTGKFDTFAAMQKSLDLSGTAACNCGTPHEARGRNTFRAVFRRWCSAARQPHFALRTTGVFVPAWARWHRSTTALITSRAPIGLQSLLLGRGCGLKLLSGLRRFRSTGFGGKTTWQHK